MSLPGRASIGPLVLWVNGSSETPLVPLERWVIHKKLAEKMASPLLGKKVPKLIAPVEASLKRVIPKLPSDKCCCQFFFRSHVI